MMNIIALIPARSGSKRIPGKNIKDFWGKPLIQWTLEAAKASRIFSDIVVSSNSTEILDIAFDLGATQQVLCPLTIAHADDDPDIKWVKHSLDTYLHRPAAFAILRATAPFRTAETIKRAWAEFRDGGDKYDSLRAVELCKQHPCKMWEIWGTEEREGMKRIEIRPFVEDFGDWRGRAIPAEVNGVPAHSSPYQVLPKVYVQNASLEMAWVRTVVETGTIAGEVVKPFFTEGYEGFDLNTPEDWILAEELVKRGLVTL